jgi:two-component system cell cycle response regulator
MAPASKRNVAKRAAPRSSSPRFGPALANEASGIKPRGFREEKEPERRDRVRELVPFAIRVRRAARASFGTASAAVLGALVLLGVFRVEPGSLGVEHAAVLGAALLVIGSRVYNRVRRHGSLARIDFEIGALLIVAGHAGLGVAGGLESAFYPALYVLVAFLASFAASPSGLLLVGLAVAFEAVLHFVTEGRRDVEPFALHAGFLVLFGALNAVFTRVEIARVRERSRKELDEEKVKVRDDARLYRLLSASSGSSQSDDERLFRSSLEEVHHALFHLLDTLRRTLELHTCVLLLLDDEKQTLRIVELATESDDIAHGPFSIGEGAVGAVARGTTMNLEHVKPGYRGLSYYREPATIRSFLGVPVFDSKELRGVLCADRLVDRPFTARDEEILKGAVHQILRTMENERLFVQLERSKREEAVLYRASQKLGAALSEDDVLDAALGAIAEIAPYDFAAVSRFDPVARRHTIRRAIGERAADFQGVTFRDNTSLTAMVVKNRHYLPYRGEFDAKQQVVYTKRANLRGMESLLILPLIVREDAIGTLALAARHRDAFGDALRPTLELLANHVAAALSNAALFKRLEELATTDGLTGCLNKRAFHDELEKKLRAAERFNRPLSLLVTDIDHFKRVNDTYGHAIGDVVIKELGEILKRVKRDTDIVARFGGEEFCVLCEETETKGARLLAERIREELGATAFSTELGKLGVTASLGVATFPVDAADGGGLFEVADKALYAAKRNGRNRVCTVDDA